MCVCLAFYSSSQIHHHLSQSAIFSPWYTPFSNALDPPESPRLVEGLRTALQFWQHRNQPAEEWWFRDIIAVIHGEFYRHLQRIYIFSAGSYMLHHFTIDSIKYFVLWVNNDMFTIPQSSP